MIDESATGRYLIAEPFSQAAKLLRKALLGADLKVTGELDMSGRIVRALHIDIAPCLVLLACPLTPAAFGSDPAVAAITPLHIVVSARGAQAEVCVLRVLPRDDGLLDRSMLAATARLQTAALQAIETIGMRECLVAAPQLP